MNRKIKEKMTRELKKLFDSAIRQKVTPGGVVAVALTAGEANAGKFFFSRGNSHYGRGKREVTENTFFDLASLTKPLVTVVSLLTLIQENRISLDSSLGDLLAARFAIPYDKKGIRLWQLMSHCSGLPAHRSYFADVLAVPKGQRKDLIIHSILAENLEYPPATAHLYSDLGYILLGAAIEKLTERPLDEYFEKRISKPIGLNDVLKFGPLTDRMEQLDCAPTENEPWTHKRLCGVVHDDNCRVVMGGVAAHAGLFGTARGVVELCNIICEVWQGRDRWQLFSPELLRRLVTTREGSTWSCGFDTPSRCQSSSGKYYGPSSVGHLGFTGTSMWMDLPRGISVVLLTNRVHPSRNNVAIRRLRPEVHNIIMGNLLHVNIKKPPIR